MDSLEFQIKECSEEIIGICVLLELQNNSENNYTLTRDSLLLDGFTSDKFTVENINNHTEKISYIGRLVKYYPKEVSLDANTTLASQLDLADAYDFSLIRGDSYLISYESHISLCDEDKVCIGDVLHDQLIIKVKDNYDDL